MQDPSGSPPYPLRNMVSTYIKGNLGMHLFAIWMDHPQFCICGNKFEIDHALSCKRGGFMIQRHNELRDITATLLTEVCHNVSTEPPLLPEIFNYQTANTDSEVRLDIKARGFWNRGQGMHTLTLGFSIQMLPAIAPRI